MTTEPYTIDYYDGLRKAERIMAEKYIGCLPVMKDRSLVGILTSKDIRKAHPNRIVADAMSKPVVSVSSGTSLWKAKQTLERYNIERLLVVDDGKLVGLVTLADLYLELGKYIDLLTGLYRSDYIYHHSMELLAQGIEISVIFIDINNFGFIDKEYGHAQGDAILKELGALLKSNVPEDAYLCRFGGDEFVVLTPYKLNQCKPLAENLLKEIDANVFHNCIDVSACAGIAGGKRQGARHNASIENVLDLINLASLASTKAKKEKQRLAVAEGFCMNEEIA